MRRDFKPTHDVDELVAETERQRHAFNVLQGQIMHDDIEQALWASDTLANPEENTE